MQEKYLNNIPGREQLSMDFKGPGNGGTTGFFFIKKCNDTETHISSSSYQKSVKQPRFMIRSTLILYAMPCLTWPIISDFEN